MFELITKTMIKLIEEFKPISNDILMAMYHLQDKNTDLLLETLIKTISQILNPNKFDEIKWIWFDQFLLNSSIWFINVKNKKNEENETFYSLIEKIINEYDNKILSAKMKNDIIESKVMEEKEEWSLIMNNNNYEINKKYLDEKVMKQKEKGKIVENGIRQDNIKLFALVLQTNKLLNYY